MASISAKEYQPPPGGRVTLKQDKEKEILGPGHYSNIESAFKRKSTVPSMINFGFSKSPKKTYLDDVMKIAKAIPAAGQYSPEKADRIIIKRAGNKPLYK